MNGRMFSVSISFQHLKMLDEIIMCKMENFGYNTHPYMSSIRLWISLWKAFFYFLLHQTATEHRFKKQFYVAVVVVVFCWMEVLKGNKCYDRSLEWANFLHFYEIMADKPTNIQPNNQPRNQRTDMRGYRVVILQKIGFINRRWSGRSVTIFCYFWNETKKLQSQSTKNPSWLTRLREKLKGENAGSHFVIVAWTRTTELAIISWKRTMQQAILSYFLEQGEQSKLYFFWKRTMQQAISS